MGKSKPPVAAYALREGVCSVVCYSPHLALSLIHGPPLLPASAYKIPDCVLYTRQGRTFVRTQL